MRWALLFLLFMTIVARGDYAVKYGVAVPKDGAPLGSTKAIFVSHQSTLLGPLIEQYELGGWFDSTGIAGRKSSALIGYSLGVNVNAGYTYAQALVGPALISASDSALGGPFEFNNDIFFGLRDPDTRATIGFGYKHVSSGPLPEHPNNGRDLLLFRVSIPW